MSTFGVHYLIRFWFCQRSGNKKKNLIDGSGPRSPLPWRSYAPQTCWASVGGRKADGSPTTCGMPKTGQRKGAEELRTAPIPREAQASQRPACPVVTCPVVVCVARTVICNKKASLS